MAFHRNALEALHLRPTPKQAPRPAAAMAWVGGIGIALALLAGCATSTLPDLPVLLRWPEPPETTRIEFVRVVRNGQDLTGPPGIGQRLAAFIGLDPGSRTRAIVQPADVEVSPDGTIAYVSDFAQGIVHVFDFEQKEARYLGLEKRLARPFGLALGSDGKLYVAEQDLKQIRVMTRDGQTLGFFRSPKLIRPVDIELDEARNRLYVADGSHQSSKEHYVRMFDLDGNYLGEVGKGRGTAEGYLLFPTYLAVDPEGNLYVSDTMNSRVSVFDSEGNFVRKVGARGDGFGLFDKPKGVDIDSFGNVYVVDSSWSNVQIFGPKGHVLLYFGGRGGYPGLLRNPTGIAIARESNLMFIGDYLNRRLQVYRLVNTTAEDSIPEPGTEAVGVGP